MCTCTSGYGGMACQIDASCEAGLFRMLYSMLKFLPCTSSGVRGVVLLARHLQTNVYAQTRADSSAPRSGTRVALLQPSASFTSRWISRERGRPSGRRCSRVLLAGTALSPEFLNTDGSSLELLPPTWRFLRLDATIGVVLQPRHVVKIAAAKCSEDGIPSLHKFFSPAVLLRRSILKIPKVG